MIHIELLAKSVWSELISAVTGRLLTKEQISQITSHAVGQYFSEFFPEPENEKKAKERVEEAKAHIMKANTIIGEMQTDLETQSAQLDNLLSDIEDKKALAEKYALLAETNQEQFSELKGEMSEALRKELQKKSQDGKALRRLSSFILWVITLILGAALGTYFKEAISWAKTLIV